MPRGIYWWGGAGRAGSVCEVFDNVDIDVGREGVGTIGRGRGCIRLRCSEYRKK